MTRISLKLRAAVLRAPSVSVLQKRREVFFNEARVNRAENIHLSTTPPCRFFPSLQMAHISGSTRSSFGMHVDLKETADGYEVLADLPGMRKEDISIDVDNENNILTLSGERKQEHEENKEDAQGQRE